VFYFYVLGMLILLVDPYPAAATKLSLASKMYVCRCYQVHLPREAMTFQRNDKAKETLVKLGIIHLVIRKGSVIKILIAFPVCLFFIFFYCLSLVEWRRYPLCGYCVRYRSTVCFQVKSSEMNFNIFWLIPIKRGPLYEATLLYI